MSLIVTLWCLFLFRSVSVSSSVHTDSCLWLLTFFLHFALSQRTSPWMVMYSISFIINELVEFRDLFNDSRVLHRIWRDKSHRTVESLITDSLIIYSLEPLDASSQGCPRRSHRCHECASEGRSWHRSKGWGKWQTLHAHMCECVCMCASVCAFASSIILNTKKIALSYFDTVLYILSHEFL